MKESTKERIDTATFVTMGALGGLLGFLAGTEFSEYLVDHHETTYGVEVDEIDELGLWGNLGLIGSILGMLGFTRGYVESKRHFLNAYGNRD